MTGGEASARLRPQARMTRADHARLSAVLPHAAGAVGAALLTERLAGARLVPDAELPADVARLGGWVAYFDAGRGVKRRVQLVEPAAADVYARRFSVASPTGSGLIGLRAGEQIDWPDQYGRTRRLTLLGVGRGEG